MSKHQSDPIHSLPFPSHTCRCDPLRSDVWAYKQRLSHPFRCRAIRSLSLPSSVWTWMTTDPILSAPVHSAPVRYVGLKARADPIPSHALPSLALRCLPLLCVRLKEKTAPVQSPARPSYPLHCVLMEVKAVPIRSLPVPCSPFRSYPLCPTDPPRPATSGAAAAPGSAAVPGEWRATPPRPCRCGRRSGRAAHVLRW